MNLRAPNWLITHCIADNDFVAATEERLHIETYVGRGGTIQQSKL